ncbi:MAG TPA: carboxypeptidase-like regulatory domain-containing protein [Thermoanaerobaculia bacterium]|nr:carboxypeptidase-like regulatory domain-containing protein [Thermoanaerobaculia bacterium]
MFALLCAAAAAAGSQIAIKVDPPQAVAAISVRSGEAVVPLQVRNGVIAVPADLPFPWSLSMLRFEAEPYTRADFSQKRPWVIRELGGLRGRLEGPAQKAGDRFMWLLQRGNSEEIVERELTLEEGGSFRVPLPAGTWSGALLGAGSATRIRSGMIVKPGQTTDLGAVRASATVPVSVRVVDGATGKPVAGARVLWDPPTEILNAPLIRRLYARRWSAVTGREGIAELRSVGPVPHSVGWRIESKDYAPTPSAKLQLKEVRRTVLPDVRMRRAPTVIVRVQFPRREEEELEDGTLVAGEIQGSHSARYAPLRRVPLREGDTRFDFAAYGPKRVSIENKSGQTIFYRDFEPANEMTLLDVVLRPVEVHGRVTQKSTAMPEMIVTLADPHSAKTILSQAKTDASGEYRLSTWQSGKLYLYTTPGKRVGDSKSAGSASARVDVAGRTDIEVNLELPAAGFVLRVVDAETGAPVRGRVHHYSRFTAGGGGTEGLETDEAGSVEVSGSPTGTAKLHIEAKGYRSADLEIPITEDQDTAVVHLTRSNALAGKVTNAQGVPIPGARVLGGYADDFSDAYYQATTNERGEFQLDPAPASNTLLYVIAPGYALGMTRSATAVLHPPSPAIVSLREGNEAPENVFLVVAAPRNGTFIPLPVMDELAEAAGMTLYQLCGSSVDGDVILPEFLGPGTYDLSIARRGGKPFVYQRIGTITTPLRSNTVLAAR